MDASLYMYNLMYYKEKNMCAFWKRISGVDIKEKSIYKNKIMKNIITHA